MNKIRRLVPSALLLCTLTTQAGTFSADFSGPDTSSFILGGSGTNADGSAWAPFIATNRLIMTANQNWQSGAFSPYDFDNGTPIVSFTASFKLQFGPGTSPPADGAAFSFGPDLNQYSTTYNEVGAGGASAAVSFHTFTSNGGPAVDVYLRGQRIATKQIAIGTMVNSQLQDVLIRLKDNSTLDVTYRGEVLYTNLYLPGWAPTNTYFIISARTGGLNHETALAAVRIDTTTYTAAVAPTITAAPQNVAVAEGGSASFSVGFDGTGPFTIQWLKNGAAIQDATNQTLTLTPAHFADNNAQISAQVSNEAGNVTSAAAILSVTQDTTAPTVLKGSGDISLSAVTLKYSKAVSDTALSPSHYVLDQGVAVSSVTRVSDTTVRLVTSQMAQDTLYTLTINGVQDTASIPNNIAANTKVQFRSFIYMAGTLLRSKYLGFPDNSRSAAVLNDARFGLAPDHMDLIGTMEYPANGNGRNAVADPARNYADSIEGFFIPASTTNYVFFTAGADYWALYLSTDENPANKRLIAEVGGWTNPRGWNQGQGGTVMTPSRSDTFASIAWPDGNTITLDKGTRYYMLLIHTDPSWAGGDDFAATFKVEGEPDPAPGDPPKLTGNLVGFYIDPEGASITFNRQPQSGAAQEGGSVTFSVDVTGASAYGTNVAFQWQAAPQNSLTFTNIPGATKASYSTPPLTRAAFDGMQFRVVANMPPISRTSDIASLSVSANTTLPVPTAGAMLDATAGVVDCRCRLRQTHGRGLRQRRGQLLDLLGNNSEPGLEHQSLYIQLPGPCGDGPQTNRLVEGQRFDGLERFGNDQKHLGYLRK